jgi:hypothetical protein
MQDKPSTLQMPRQQPQVLQTMYQQQTRFPPNANSNRALQDYMMQMMLLEQQNKKRHLVKALDVANISEQSPMLESRCKWLETRKQKSFW